MLVLFVSIWLKTQFIETALSQFPSVDVVANGFIGLVSFLISCWLFTLIARFTRTRKAIWLVQDRESIGAILMTILYATGIFTLVLLAGLITSTLAFLAVSALVDYAKRQALLGSLALLGFTFGLIQLGLQYWLLLRLLVGLPAVSLGSFPHVFRGFWPLAKNESWGLPFRLFLPWLLATTLMAATLYPALMAVTILGIWPSSSQSGRAIELLMMAESTGWLPYFGASLIIVLAPIFWFFTLLLTTAYHRFSQRRRQRA